MIQGWEYVIAGYGVTFAVLFLYSFWVIRKGKKLAEKVPENRRRFLD